MKEKTKSRLDNPWILVLILFAIIIPLGLLFGTFLGNSSSVIATVIALLIVSNLYASRNKRQMPGYLRVKMLVIFFSIQLILALLVIIFGVFVDEMRIGFAVIAFVITAVITSLLAIFSYYILGAFGKTYPKSSRRR